MLLTGAVLLALTASGTPSVDKAYFEITVVDAETKRGVPLVELKTVNHIRYVSDSNGVIAFFEPGLMNTTVYFDVKSHGYEFPKDGFGRRGRQFRILPGGKAVLEVHRKNIAQRLYRVTGGGIYRDSVLTGHRVPLEKPVIDGLVFGSDSVVNTVYHGKIYWFWGDTSRPSYPLGNFNVPGATSELPANGGLDPDVGVNLHYFVGRDGFARPTAPIPGAGPTWIGGLVTLTDAEGRERMFANYAKIAQPMRVYERGLAEFNDEKNLFEKRLQFDMNATLGPGGHPFKHTVDGVDYIYFVEGYPPVRVKATVDDLMDLSKYEAFSCLQQGCRADAAKLDRDESGSLHYDWKAYTPALSQQLASKLIRDGGMRPDESLLQLQDADTGKPVNAHAGSIYWNDYRKRYVSIRLESFGSPSFLGEIWYAEADSPTGPWVYARKIVSHDNYSFYNPKQHPMFDKDGGRSIFFEGTYTSTFTNHARPTPRYDYNQIMYKLDLSDPQLVLPVPVYRIAGPAGNMRLATRNDLLPDDDPADVPFFALDRGRPDAVPVFAKISGNGDVILNVGVGSNSQESAGAPPLFYALPVDSKDAPKTSLPLYEFTNRKESRVFYGTDPDLSRPGFQRVEQPVCRVWRNPLSVMIPLE